MKGRIVPKEEGQTLVMLALAMVALLAFLALAIDMGSVYAERRLMQNAADAGALAGAYELCFGEPDQALATAREYAISRNGAQDAVASFYPNSWTVDVVASETVDTFFAGVIGIPTIPVAAEAAAECGPADRACALWPIGFPELDFDDYYAHCFLPGPPKHLYIWAGHQEDKNPDCWNTACDECCDADGCDDCDPEYHCSPDQCDCDVDNDRVNDIVDFYGRAWLDFTDVLDPFYGDDCSRGEGCGEREIECWMLGGAGKVTIPSCIQGDPGVRAGVKDEVEEVAGREWPDNIVGVPLYTDMECDQPGTSCPKDLQYDVTDLGCVKVLGWIMKLELPFATEDPERKGNDICWWGKVIEVEVDCGDNCTTLCGGIGGDTSGAVRAVSLIK